jgi:hypothetical protein
VFYAALHYMLSLSFDFNIHMEHKCCSTASIIMSAVKMKAKLPQGNCSRRIEFDSQKRLVGASFAGRPSWSTTRGLETPLALGTVEKRSRSEKGWKLSAFTANCYNLTLIIVSSR